MGDLAPRGEGREEPDDDGSQANLDGRQRDRVIARVGEEPAHVESGEAVGNGGTEAGELRWQQLWRLADADELPGRREHDDTAEPHDEPDNLRAREPLADEYKRHEQQRHDGRRRVVDAREAARHVLARPGEERVGHNRKREGHDKHVHPDRPTPWPASARDQHDRDERCGPRA